LISSPQSGGIVSTRTFIPHRVHEAIGVLGAVSVATACLLPGSVAEGIAQVAVRDGQQRLDIEHPTGFFTVDMELESAGGVVAVKRSALLRTARKLMEGRVFIPGAVWSGA
jgi:4-oxalomesaconate tautomerase